VRRLQLTEIAQADLKSIRRYSERRWGSEQTGHYLSALQNTMKRLAAGTTASRARDDLRPGLQMVASGRHCIFFEPDEHRVLVIRILHQRMDFPNHVKSSG
jgi:toxin ParE1/3/4